jgi:ABC-type multidrug transport system ATPase subunit
MDGISSNGRSQLQARAEPGLEQIAGNERELAAEMQAAEHSAEPAGDAGTGVASPTKMIKYQVRLEFNDIKYVVKEKENQKQILGGVSGVVKPGEMLSIMGPSGSGKTSLVHIISKKITSGPSKVIEGKVLCNGREHTSSEFQRIAGLVTQEDVFNAALTVQETLKYSAALKLPKAQRQERTETVISQLQLENCVKTYVGDDSNPYLKGISGGEKRRLAIAIEILDPGLSLLLLDEPTSGLDAAAALNVTNLLRTLSDTGITVVATLHQPRSSIMQRFNKLMVIADGKSVYYGGLSEYVPYLKTELQCEVPEYESPYDLFLDALNPAIELGTTIMKAVPQDCENVATELADIFARSSLSTRTEPAAEPASDKAEMVDAAWSADWFSKFWIILCRTFFIKMRDPIVLATQLSSAVLLGAVFGVLYWQVYDKSDEYALLDTQMAVTMTVITAIFLPYDVTLTFPTERKIFLRERKAGLYQTSAFFLARICSDMPMHILAGAVMALIVYPMAGFKGNLLYWVVVNVVGILSGAALMQMVGALSRTFEEANLLMMLILMLSMVMSTGFVREPPKFLEWLREISTMGITADLAMYFEFQDIDEKFGTPDQIYESYAVRVKSDDDMVSAFVTLLIIYVVARLITFLAVKFLHTGRDVRENLRD